MDDSHISQSPTPPGQLTDAVFARRVLIAIGLVGVALLLVYLSNLLLLIVAAVVVAVVLRAVARAIGRVLPLSDGWAVLPATLVILVVIGLAVWLFGRQMADQITILISRLPQDWGALQGKVQQLPLGPVIVKQLQHVGDWAASFASQVPLIAVGVAGAVTDLVFAVVGGVMLAMEPKSYRDGLLLLIPRSARPACRRALDATGHALTGWLLAQLIAMVLIGLLTGIGLWLVGVPSALGLGLFAGVAQFVPVLGPIASAVPGLLVAATTGWDTLFYAALVYIGVQQSEGNLITPFVQKHFAGIPMALALFAILAFGALFGPLGVILATPLALIGLVLVRSLYINDLLGEDVAMPGEHVKDTKVATTP